MSTKSHISFLFNGELITIDFSSSELKPSTTVLNWLRKNQHHTGVKEGCAEGDCGACTVVVASPDNSGAHLVYKALNSCLLFLPALDGKLLITTSGLSQQTTLLESLHPVQRAIVEEHATQCGFCTPGVVMSLFALYHQRQPLSNDEVVNALAGNLCRCTGYNSIRQAAEKALKHIQPDLFDEAEKDLLARLKKITPSSTLHIHAVDQLYIKPVSLEEALKERQSHPEAILINGSTDIALQQSKHFRHLPAILDLSEVNEIKYFYTEDQSLRIGAGLSLESLRNQVKDLFPALYSILSVFASKQIRQVGTLGGNIGSASPIGDTLPLLMACNASVELVSAKENRMMPLRDFIVSYRKTALHNDEIITGILLPLPDKTEIVKAYKVSKRKDMDISTVSAAFRLILEQNMVKDISVFYGGMAAQTMQAAKTEEALCEKEWSDVTIESAMEIVKHEFSPLSDARSGASFRAVAASQLLLQFFNDTQSGGI